MKNALIAIALCGAAVVWFARDDEEPQRQIADTSWNFDKVEAGEAKAGGDGVQFRANTESGEMELSLPGGIKGKMRLPDALDRDTKFDLDGIGRYPGAKLASVDVSGSPSTGGRVILGFSAPGSADTVADWYEKALKAKGRSVARTGNTITGATKSGEPMVIAVEDGPGDIARGRIIITDTD
jgi:hypothetical protein